MTISPNETCGGQAGEKSSVRLEAVLFLPSNLQIPEKNNPFNSLDILDVC